MGFLDKAKAQVEQAVKQGQDKIEDVQAKKKADAMLRDLGAWHYASETGRDEGKGPAEMERLTAALQAHEAENGPLGASADDDDDAELDADPGTGDGTPTGASAPPVPSPPPATAPPSPPPPTGAPPAPGAPPPPVSDDPGASS